MANENLGNGTNIRISEDNSNGNTCIKSNYTTFKNSLINSQICRNLEALNSKEFENTKQQLKIYRKQVEYLLKMNCQLQSELNESVQTNLLMEQNLTCPFMIKEGEVEFPGKNDLDKRFDCIFTMLMHMKNDLKTVQNKNFLVHKLDHILHLPMPKCYDSCQNNFNEH